MQLEQLAINLRPRNPWEALDLGGVLAAEWRGPALRAWLATYWVCGLLLLAILHDHLEAAGLILWWLKPAFDRVLLHVYGRALFGETPTLGETLRALPSLLKAPGLLSALTLRRFSTARSLLLPVWQLEQQKGKAARQRFKVLGARCRGHAFWLTFLCANMVTILWLAEVALIQLLVPEGQGGLFSWDELVRGDLAEWKVLVSSLLWMAAETFVEPFFMASGFALYLNRRSELEGWDMELTFRRMSQRKRSEAAPSRLLGLGFGLLCATLLLAMPTESAWAQPAAEGETPAAISDAPTPAPQEGPRPARKAIDAVLARPVFGQPKEDWEWRLIPEEQKPVDPLSPGWMKLLQALTRGIAALGKVAVALLAIAAFCIFAWLLWRTRHAWWPQAAEKRVVQETLFGLDVRPESLPPDVAGAARGALANGDVVAALSLLYRGALSALIHRHQAEFRAGDTEDSCLARSRLHLAAEAFAYFTRLLVAWRLAAYGHRPPPTEALQALCDEWPAHFAEQSP